MRPSKGSCRWDHPNGNESAIQHDSTIVGKNFQKNALSSDVLHFLFNIRCLINVGCPLAPFACHVGFSHTSCLLWWVHILFLTQNRKRCTEKKSSNIRPQLFTTIIEWHMPRVESSWQLIGIGSMSCRKNCCTNACYAPKWWCTCLCLRPSQACFANLVSVIQVSLCNGIP